MTSITTVPQKLYYSSQQFPYSYIIWDLDIFFTKAIENSTFLASSTNWKYDLLYMSRKLWTQRFQKHKIHAYVYYASIRNLDFLLYLIPQVNPQKQSFKGPHKLVYDMFYHNFLCIYEKLYFPLVEDAKKAEFSIAFVKKMSKSQMIQLQGNC